MCIILGFFGGASPYLFSPSIDLVGWEVMEHVFQHHCCFYLSNWIEFAHYLLVP